MAEERKKKGMSLLTIVLLILVFFLSGGYAYRFLFGSAFADKEPSGRSDLAGYQKLVLEPIVVNLKEPGVKKYLRVKITLEYQDGRLTGELNEKTHRIYDAIIGVLRSKGVEDLQNQEALKKELLTAINSHLLGGQVKAIYFEEFITQ